MGFTNALRRQFRSVIEWPTNQEQLLFSQWTDNGDEIKNASQLIVKPGQGCVFVYRGRIRAMLHRPGVYPLKTANIPFITTLMKFMQFFESEHKVGIYFFNCAQVLDQKWGTSNTVIYQDPHYQFPIGLKAYGNYSYQLSDPRFFFTELLASRSQLSFDELRQILSQRLLQPITDYFAESQHSYTQLMASLEEISQGITQNLPPLFAKLGLKLLDFRIEGVNFDDDTNARINRVADVSASAMAAQQAGLSFSQLQQLEALKAAAENQSGAAGAGVGIGAGIGLGQQLSEAMSTQSLASSASEPSLKDKLSKLKQLYEQALISEDDYNTKKQQLLEEL